jgi:hypothetical protein
VAMENFDTGYRFCLGLKKILLEEEYSSRYMVDIIVIQYNKAFYLLCFESKKKTEISP